MFPGQDLSGVGQQEGQHIDLLGTHVDLLVADEDLVGIGQNGQFGQCQLFDFMDGVQPFQGFADANNHFPGRKGFGHIVVGTYLQTNDAVQFLAFGAEHNNVNVTDFSRFAADFVSVHARKHDVQNHDVDLPAAQFFQGRLAVKSRDHIDFFGI